MIAKVIPAGVRAALVRPNAGRYRLDGGTEADASVTGPVVLELPPGARRVLHVEQDAEESVQFLDEAVELPGQWDGCSRKGFWADGSSTAKWKTLGTYAQLTGTAFDPGGGGDGGSFFPPGVADNGGQVWGPRMMNGCSLISGSHVLTRVTAGLLTGIDFRFYLEDATLGVIPLQFGDLKFQIGGFFPQYSTGFSAESTEPHGWTNYCRTSNVLNVLYPFSAEAARRVAERRTEGLVPWMESNSKSNLAWLTSGTYPSIIMEVTPYVRA